jgi:hypothetical protein
MADGEPTQPDEGADIAAAEHWFTQHGLPWFVDAEHDRVNRLLGPGRLTRIALLAAVPALALGIGLGLWSRDVSNGLAVFATVAGLGVLLWAGWRLRAGIVVRWAASRTHGQLRLLFHLVTRALPLLLIFTVFFFINTEVWQVASSLTPGVLWLSVLFFAGLAVLFLVARLPEEVDRVVAEVDADGDGSRLVAVCGGTPLADAARRLVTGLTAHQRATLEVPLTRLQRGNLILVLLLIQAGQVLLLALSVFAFFVVFGMVAIRPEIITSWVGEQAPHGSPLSVELLQVAIFLSGFSGLYFTVYAVTDPNYRQQFFTQLSTELERAVGVRAVYSVLRRPHAPEDPS